MKKSEEFIEHIEEETEEIGEKIMIKVGKLKKPLIIAAVVIVIIALVVITIWAQSTRIKELNDQLDEIMNTPLVKDDIAPEITLDVINAEIKKIGELATMEYYYTNAAKFSESKQVKEWNIPFTKKSFIMKWDGVIKAGIEVNEISTSLNPITKVLTIKLPEARILSHDPDSSSVEILDENDGLFNPVTLDDQAKFDVATEQEMEQRAIDNGLLEKAQKNAEDIISKLLYANPDINGNYIIEFK